MAPTTSLFGLLLIAFLLAALLFYFLPLAFVDNQRFCFVWSLVGFLLAYFCWWHLTPPAIGADGAYYAGDAQVAAFVIAQWAFAAFTQLGDKLLNRRGIRRRKLVVAGGWISSLAVTFVLIRLINAQTV